VPVTVDTQGRVRASKEQRRVILAEFERSGVSAAQFAKLTGLKYSTLAGWLQRYRRTKPPGRARQVRLLEAVVEPAHGAGGQTPAVLVLQLPGGVRLEVADDRQAALAAVLVRALARSC
jgi:transposase-like protein